MPLDDYSLDVNEEPPDNCQSHLTQDTVNILQLNMEHPTTPEALDYMMGLDHPTNPHLMHWLSTGLGRHWIEHQEELK